MNSKILKKSDIIFPFRNVWKISFQPKLKTENAPSIFCDLHLMQMPFKVAFSFALSCKISPFLFSITFLLLIFLFRESSSSRFEKWMMKPFQTIPCCRARVFFSSNKNNLVVVYSQGMQSVGLMPFRFSPKSTADRLFFLFVSMQKCVFRQGQAENRIENVNGVQRWQSLKRSVSTATKNWDCITAMLQYMVLNWANTKVGRKRQEFVPGRDYWLLFSKYTVHI